MVINIATDFSQTPGGRYRIESNYSAEEFRDDYLEPMLVNCLFSGDTLFINMDGVYGYSVGFLEEVFGGLVRKGYDNELYNIKLICCDDPVVIELINRFISDAIKSRNSKNKIKKL